MSALVIHQPLTLGRSRARVDVGAALLRVDRQRRLQVGGQLRDERLVVGRRLTQQRLHLLTMRRLHPPHGSSGRAPISDANGVRPYLGPVNPV